MMTSDYITITTWDEKYQCIRYRYVHKSIDKPKEYILSLYPEERLL